MLPLPGRDILIPVSNIRILCGDQWLVEINSTIICLPVCRLHIRINGVTISLRQWPVSRWKCSKTQACMRIKTEWWAMIHSLLTMQTEKPIIVKRVTIGQPWDSIPVWTGTTRMSIFWNLADVMMVRHVSLPAIVGDFSLLSLPVMTLPVPTTSSNGACLFHSWKCVCLTDV